MKRKTYKIVTLGCRTNQYESQAYVNQLQEKGYVLAKKGEKADICIVNTCTVTASADKKSLYQIRKLKKEFQPEKLIVTGCLVSGSKKRGALLEEADAIVQNDHKENLLPMIFPDESWSEFKINHFEAHTRAFVKIQDGCNSYCSYCVIPFVRGRSRSKSVEEIVKEIQILVENGYREVVLTGINIGDFDGGYQEKKVSLSTLVQEIDRIEGLERIRLSSIDPDEVDQALVETLIHGKKTCQSMHVVLQSGSNLILKRMRRKYTKQDFLKTASRLLKENPDFTFTTDIIVGFPGETEADFLETVEMVQKMRFAKVHLFPYSDRPYTRASRMSFKIDQKVITHRMKTLKELSDQVAYDLRKAYLGRHFKILLEAKEKEGWLKGHTTHFLPVYLPKEKGRLGEIVSVQCLENQKEAMIGKKVGEI